MDQHPLIKYNFFCWRTVYSNAGEFTQSTFTLGIMNGRKMKELMSFLYRCCKRHFHDINYHCRFRSIKAGIIRQRYKHRSATTATLMAITPLFLGWLIAAIIRVCVGSATVAGLTTAGIILPLFSNQSVDPNLMVLSIGAGSLFFSMSMIQDSGCSKNILI